MGTSVFLVNKVTKKAFELGKWRMSAFEDALATRPNRQVLVDAIRSDLQQFHDLSVAESVEPAKKLAEFALSFDDMDFITENDDRIEDYVVINTLYYAGDETARERHIAILNDHETLGEEE